MVSLQQKKNFVHFLRPHVFHIFSLPHRTTHPTFLFAANDKTLLNEIFIQCGYQELVFIRNSGATLGFLFGFVQMIIWAFWHPAVEVPLQPTIQGDQMSEC